jgi:hypothetical protein
MSNFIPGVLSQVSESETGIRGLEIEGEFEFLPEVGRGFQIFGKPINSAADVRMVWTSRVQKIVDSEPGKTTFKTENTLYTLEYTVS